MARYFKLVEIDRDSFIEATGDDLDCLQVVDVCEGIGYVAIADTETEMTIDLDVFEEERLCSFGSQARLSGRCL